MMKYSLVLQFPANDIKDYDTLIEIEDALTKYLYGLANVDGHDSGSGEMNIFILTDKAEEAFEKAKLIIKAAGMLTKLSAAYRLTRGEDYSRLWPVGSTEPFMVA